MVHLVTFSIHQALEGLWRNRVMSLAATVTMVMMLVLLSSLVIVLSGMQAGLSFVESKVEIRVELAEGVAQERVDTLNAQLLALPEVADVVYISKEQALADFTQQRIADGQPDLTDYISNPFPNQLSIKLRDPRQASQVNAVLDAERGAVVANVIDKQADIDKLVSVTATLRTVGVAVLALVGLTVLLIVVNSIRMAVMSRSQEIEIMRLVGASDQFVRWPFIVEGLLVGLLGALVTLTLLLLASGPISEIAKVIAGQVPVGFSQSLTFQVTSLVMIAGLGLGGVGAWIFGPDIPQKHDLTGMSVPTGYDPSGQPVQASPEPTSASRTPLVAALILVAVLAGSALFASGFTLGIQQSLAPGTSAGEQQMFDPFWEAYRKIRAEYVGSYDPELLVEGAIKGMFGALDDPYSSYMTSQEYKDSLAGITGEFEGIGATMAALDDTGATCTPLGPACRLVVVSVVPDSPAQVGGLLADDQLTAVDGVTVDGSTVNETVQRVRGPQGSEVRLSLLRAGEPMELSLTREVIQTTSVTNELVADGTVGYLRIDGFSGNAAEDLVTGLQGYLDAGVTRFVLDLRDDPGGFVDAALTIASQFVPSGPIYWEEYADGRKIPVDAEPDGIATDEGIKVVVLVNAGSASASEILAGALQDTGRATLVGETTYGKGTIQQWHLLSGESGGFRLSIAKWLTPDQHWVHGTGITPDSVVPIPDGTPEGEDPQLDRALEIVAAGPASSSSPDASATAGPTPTN